MLVKFFKANNPVLIISLLLIAALLWLASVINVKEQIISGNQMPLFNFFYSFLGANKIVAAIISILLITGQAILLNTTINQHHLTKRQNYLPALFYVLLMCAVPETLFLHPVLFANLFLIFTVNRCFDLLGSANTASVAFDSAFFTSIASLFYFPSAVFLLFVLIALVSFRPFSMRNWIIAILGIALPYLFAGMYFYWFDESREFWVETIYLSSIQKEFVKINFLKSFYTFVFFLLLMIILSVPPLISEMRRNKASIRSGLRLFIWFGFFALISFLLSPNYALYHFCFAAITLSIIISTFFFNIKPVLAEVLLSFFIFLIIIYQVNYY